MRFIKQVMLCVALLAVTAAQAQAGNDYTISGATINNNVHGDSSVGAPNYNTGLESSMTDNTLTIDTSAITGDVLGASADVVSTPSVSGNIVKITDTTVSGSVYGGKNKTSPSSGSKAENNKVEISGDTSSAGYVYGGYVWNGGTPLANALTNEVTINGGTVIDVFGGFSNATKSGNPPGRASSNFNTVTIAGGTMRNVAGGFGTTSDGNAYANSNTVNISSGIISGNVYGGYVQTAPSSYGGSSSDNTVNISGGSIGGNIYGGLSTGAEGKINGGRYNTVIISGTPTFASTTNIYGAFAGTNMTTEHSDTSNSYGGNGLALHSAGVTINGLYNFQELAFYVPDTLAAGGTMLNVTGTAQVDKTTVKVGIKGGGSPLKKADKIVLINAGTLDGTPTTTSTKGTGMRGITQGFGFDVRPEGNQLMAIVTNVPGDGGDDGGDDGSGDGDDGGSGGGDGGGSGDGGGNGGNTRSHIKAQLKSLAESRVTGLGMLTMGGDMLAMQAIPQMHSGAAGLTQAGMVPFGVMGGSSIRHKSGSHVDTDGFNLATGLGWNAPLSNANLLAGVFFEAGWGDYDAHNSFRGGNVKGKGNTNYYGAGLLGRYDAAPTGPGNIYTEASFRMGRVKTDYDSKDFLSSTGGRVNFDSSSTYYGAHAGLGYLWKFSEKSSLDMYTKYLWTRQDSDSVKIQGDSVRFKTTDSHRWRTGARLSHTMKNTKSDIVFTPYIGAAYEREFDGKTRATAGGKSISAPSVRGNTGIGELGFTFKPSPTSGFSANLGVQGYTGKHEGIGGSLQIKFEF